MVEEPRSAVEVEIQWVSCWSEAPEEGATHFCVGVQVLIGEKGGGPADSFDMTVASPSWVRDNLEDLLCQPDDALPGGTIFPVQGLWLMTVWSLAELERALARLVPAYSPGPDFGTVAARIARVIPWEYDYRHDDRTNVAAGLPPLAASFWHDDVGPVRDRGRST